MLQAQIAQKALFDQLEKHLWHQILLNSILLQSQYCGGHSTPSSFITVREKEEKQRMYNVTSSTGPSSEEDGAEKMYKNRHFETYRELKEIAKEEEPGISKTEIYEKLLKPFKYDKSLQTDSRTGKSHTIYTCKYGECDKEYNKIWNLLDHVRMHEGIKPYKCKECGKTFTQKGNLKKHSKQHSVVSLKDRKRFQCHVCLKKYTERYNLVVSIFPEL